MNEWMLYKISDRQLSKDETHEYFALYFINLETRQRAKTYITVGYKNNEWWAHIILDELYGIYTFKGMKTKVDGRGSTLIDADSIPVLKHPATIDEADAIYQSLTAAVRKL
jgi:hypothetical protein